MWLRVRAGCVEVVAGLSLFIASWVAACGGSPSSAPGLDAAPQTDAPVPDTGRSKPIAISLGGAFGVALLDNGAVEMWGANTNHQVCNAIARDGNNVRLTPPLLVGTPAGTVLTNAVQAEAGTEHLCIRLAGGGIECCGSNLDRQLGIVKTTGSSEGLPVVGSDGVALTGATAVSAGSNHTCALFEGGKVRCWGHNGNGELGEGTNTFRPAPVSVLGLGGLGMLEGVTDLSAGTFHTCVVLVDTSIACWGSDAAGELGNAAALGASPFNSPFPVQVLLGTGSPLMGAVRVASGFFYSCALLANGGVVCWGEGGRGRAPSPTIRDRMAAPILASTGSPLDRAVAISAGIDHTCVLLADGMAACWGKNDAGQLGDGSMINSPVAMVVPGLTDLSAVAAGGTSNQGAHSCALKKDGTIICWGSNSHGQLGDPAVTSLSSPIPVTVVGL